MADDEDHDVNEEEETKPEVEEKKKTPFFNREDPPKPEISEAELAMEKMRKKKEEEEAMWAEYIEQRKIQKQKEEEELKKLKERQVKRKERRKEEEKKLLALKKQQEAQRIKEMEEKKSKEAEAKKKRLEEAEKKRQAMQAALQKNKLPENVTPNFVITKRNEDGSPSFDKLPTSLYMKAEMAKTKEQLQEDKKIALGVRVKPLNIEGLNPQELKSKAQELWEAIVRLESEKYDLEERRKRQEYDLKELSERQRQINRSKALKKGLDPDALSGKHPPMINVASKYERRLDRRNFTDKKSLFEGGYISHLEAHFESEWENKTKSFKDRGPSKLIKWDPNAARNKEKQEITESIEEEDDLGENPYLTDPDNKQETDEVAEEEEREEEEEEGEEE
nr:troponin T isoform X4 [Parasteatoda tepidariorum]